MEYPTAPPVQAPAEAAPAPWRRMLDAAARVDWRSLLELADPRPLWRRRPAWLRGREDDRLSALAMAGYATGLALFAGVLLASVAVFAMAGLTAFEGVVGLPVCVAAVACGAAALWRGRETRQHPPTVLLAVAGIVLPFVWTVVWFHVVG